MTFQEFVEEYKPIKNKYFPKAAYDGYLFAPENLALISAFLTERKMWTVVTKKKIISELTGETREYNVIVPGYHTLSKIGYFVTEVAYPRSLKVEVNL